jgi:hypothetical protein
MILQPEPNRLVTLFLKRCPMYTVGADKTPTLNTPSDLSRLSQQTTSFPVFSTRITPQTCFVLIATTETHEQEHVAGSVENTIALDVYWKAMPS